MAFHFFGFFFSSKLWAIEEISSLGFHFIVLSNNVYKFYGFHSYIFKHDTYLIIVLDLEHTHQKFMLRCLCLLLSETISCYDTYPVC